MTPKHQLRDAKEEYEQAVYRFREAEQTNSPDLIALKREWSSWVASSGRTADGSTRTNRLRSMSSCLRRQIGVLSPPGSELRLNKDGAVQQQMQQQQ